MRYLHLAGACEILLWDRGCACRPVPARRTRQRDVFTGIRQGMAEFVLWLEGVDFDNTLLDTNDISTIRGASLTLLAAPSFAVSYLKSRLGDKSVQEIFSGASLAAIKLSGEEKGTRQAITGLMEQLCSAGEDPVEIKLAKERIRKSRLRNIDSAPYAHMRIVQGLAKAGSGGLDEAIAKAQSEAQSKRYCEDGVRFVMNRAEDVPAKPCARAPMRAAEIMWQGPEGKEPLSRATAARREFGRWARQGFYAANLGGESERFDWSRYSFVNDLQQMTDLTEDPDRTRGEKTFKRGLVRRNKIALFYADGNKFTSIREKIKKDLGAENGLRTFSGQLLRLQRSEFLTLIVRRLLDETAAGRDYTRAAYFDLNEKIYRLRLETFEWGGDEVMFAMPSWLGWWFARTFFDVVADWEITYKDAGNRTVHHPLTFKAGLVFCDRKTPVRSARALVRALGDQAGDAIRDKEHPESWLEAEVLESLDPPQEGIAELRRRLTGVDPGGSGKGRLAIAGDEVAGFIGNIWRLKEKEGQAAGDDHYLPRSQVYRVLHELTRKGVGLADGGAQAQDLFEGYMKRAGAERGGQFELSDINLTPTGSSVDDFALNLYQLAQHWDYVDAFCATAGPAGAGA